MTWFLEKIVFILSAIFVGFHLYFGIFGAMPGIAQRSIHLGLIMTIFLFSQIAKTNRGVFRKSGDLILLVFGITGSIYVTIVSSSDEMRMGLFSIYDTIFGAMLIISLLVVCRRTVGNALTAIVVIFIAYAFWGNYFPFVLRHGGMSVGRFFSLTVLSTSGIYGMALYASAVYIVLFIIMGAIFNETGVGDTFTNLANILVGRLKGGPAKASVISSGFFGSISGSAVANVIGTGTFTIPFDEKDWFHTPLCWRSGSCGIYRWPDYATGYGCSGIFDGRSPSHSVHFSCEGCSYSRDTILLRNFNDSASACS
jgi:TRAP-type uncharacterized transport system fused permease subunit